MRRETGVSVKALVSGVGRIKGSFAEWITIKCTVSDCFKSADIIVKI